jgi:tetratricopeptide (TPR) repeat protein
LQVYGPIHKDVADCHSILSHVFQAFQEIDSAWAHQQQATAIFERITGTDSLATGNAYGNLALITRKVSRPAIALNYIRRAIFIHLLCSGAHNPEMWNLFQQYSDTLSEAGKKEEAVDAAKRALLLAEPYLGTSHTVMAQLLHSLALRLSAVHSFREALGYEKRSFAILKDAFGEKSPRTEESNMWLQKLTKMAVQAEVDNKKKQATATPGAKHSQAAAPSQSSPQALHNLPVAQLVQYINAGSSKRGAVGGRRGTPGVSAVRPVASSAPKPSQSTPAPAPAAGGNGAAASSNGAAQSKKQQKKKAASKAQ